MAPIKNIHARIIQDITAYDAVKNSISKNHLSSLSKTITYDKKLEGLRGLCALMVAVSHLFTFNYFGTTKIPFYNIIVHFEFAHESVLIFFILSGYVIGINHLQTPLNYKNAINYLKKRAVRLYPIYLIALIISFSVYAKTSFNTGQLVGHIFFTQEFLVKTIASNLPLWSLSYEVLYYLLFIGIWYIKKFSIYWSLLLLIIVLAYIFTGADFTVFKSLLVGWLFWLTGFYISQNAPVKQETNIKPPSSPLISYFAVVLAIHCFNTRFLMLYFLHRQNNYDYQMGLGDFVFIPICAIIILDITNRTIPFYNYLKILAYLIPAFNLFLLFYFKHPVSSSLDWEFGLIYFVIAIISLPVKIITTVFEKLEYFGKSSYAIYVFHFPIAFFLNVFLAHYFSGIGLLIIGLASWTVLTFALSISTELYLQPRIRKYLLNRS